jgi:APA family basic amino acid/polyamine antiporter
VSLGAATGVAGPSTLIAILLAALLATCSALSSAQLAAAIPVSGGAYEYGHRLINGDIGFMAGWLFLLAKSASAAAAAKGAAGYILQLIGRPEHGLLATFAFTIAGAVTALVVSGLRRSSRLNAAIVSLSVIALTALIILATPHVLEAAPAAFTPFFTGGPDGGFGDVLHATALMFVAFAGFARVATLGEEVINPSQTIPRAIICTVVISSLLYLGIAAVSIGVLDPRDLGLANSNDRAPLQEVAADLAIPFLPELITIAAIAAILGVLLNLLLGLSRMAFAMARRCELPPVLARLQRTTREPVIAVVATGAVVMGLSLLGDIEVMWSFSAFSILIYYGVTNLAALRLPESQRRYPRAIALAGLIGCALIAFRLPPPVWMAGLALIAIGALWRIIALKMWAPPGSARDVTPG